VILTCLGAGAARGATVVAAVGDSITQNSGWTDRLGAKLGAAYTVRNFGLSGTTLLKQGDHPYWTSTQYTQSHTSNPDVVVIMLGTNDSKPYNWNDHKGEFVGDYEALIDTYAALASHPKIYVVICPPAGTNGFNISGAVIEHEVNPRIVQVAAEKGLPTIDMFKAFGGHDFDKTLFGSAGDQVHPGGAGAQRIADTVYAALVAPVTDGGATDAGKDAASPDAGAKPDGAAEKPAPPDASGAAGASGGAGTSGQAGTGAAGTSAAAGTGGGAAGTGVQPPTATDDAVCGCAVGGASGGFGLAGLALALALALSRRRR
jgi:MYXO-CTERM domain-containing protein